MNDEKRAKRKSSVRWSEAEFEIIAEATAINLKNSPEITGFSAFNKAQTDFLTPDRRKVPPSWTAIPEPFHKMFKSVWDRKTSNVGYTTKHVQSPHAPAPAPAAIPKNDDPIIVHVEVEKPVKITDLVEQFDLATLEAAVSKKKMLIDEEKTDRLERLISAITNKPVEPKKVERTYAPVIINPPPITKKHVPRVAIIGPFKDQFNDIERKVREFKIGVELIFCDKEDSKTNIPPSCQFAIVTRHSRHKWWDAARTQLGSDNVFFLHGETEAVNKCRDIASRQ
jgi:hypothetical protein